MTKNQYPGKFIVLEGLDGAGKSTQAPLILDFLKCKGRLAHQTSEPTQFLPGGLVRSRLMGEWKSSADCLQLLFAADRADHIEKEIAPKLKFGVDVVCDRYFMSSLAYGAVDSDFDWLAQINSRFLIPDLTIYLDVPPKICAQRLAANGKSIELFEKVEILEKVAHNYQKAIEANRGRMEIAVIDGNRSKEAVFKDILSKIENLKIKM
jgi:dTMP kinase